MKIIGHERVLTMLERESSSPSGAYMLVGAGGVGKATVARWFAARLLCPTGGVHAEECRSCRLVQTGNHPDLVSVEPEGRQSLGVEVARATVQAASMTPVEADRKVFVIEDAGNMTEQAANALLKTLEEPTETTVFIIAIESEDLLPATVASRCHTVHFGRVSETELVSGLVAAGVDADRAQSLARMAGGRPGLALTLAKNPAAAEFRSKWLQVPTRVTGRPGEAFLLADEMYASPEALLTEVGADGDNSEKADREKRRTQNALLATGLEMLASFYADAAAIQLGGPIRNGDVPVADLTAVGPFRAAEKAGLVLDTIGDLQMNLRPKLLLANLFVALAD